MARCLFNSSFKEFLELDNNSILGILCGRYHSEALATTREAWKSELYILKRILPNFSNTQK